MFFYEKIFCNLLKKEVNDFPENGVYNYKNAYNLLYCNHEFLWCKDFYGLVDIKLYREEVSHCSFLSQYL